MSDPVATRKDIDELLDLMRTFMGQVDERFTGVEGRLDGVERRLDGVERRAIRIEHNVDELKVDLKQIQKDMQRILNHIDSIEKDISINEDERAVIGMQLTRLHDWVEKAASKVGVEFTH